MSYVGKSRTCLPHAGYFEDLPEGPKDNTFWTYLFAEALIIVLLIGFIVLIVK